MDLPTSAVHVTRAASIKLLGNIQKRLPSKNLSDRRIMEKKSYAQALKTCEQISVNHYNHWKRQANCLHCGILGHTPHVCKFQEPIECLSCGWHGH